MLQYVPWSRELQLPCYFRIRPVIGQFAHILSVLDPACVRDMREALVPRRACPRLLRLPNRTQPSERIVLPPTFA